MSMMIPFFQTGGGLAIVMSLLDALQTLVIFALERGGDEETMVRRAITRLEPKIENLKRQKRTEWHACPRCGGQAHAVLCWSCKQDLPEWLGKLDALTAMCESEERRDVDEQILAWAIQKRRAA